MMDIGFAICISSLIIAVAFLMAIKRVAEAFEYFVLHWGEYNKSRG